MFSSCICIFFRFFEGHYSVHRTVSDDESDFMAYYFSIYRHSSRRRLCDLFVNSLFHYLLVIIRFIILSFGYACILVEVMLILLLLKVPPRLAPTVSVRRKMKFSVFRIIWEIVGVTRSGYVLLSLMTDVTSISVQSMLRHLTPS
jgi:predicted membrane protein